LSKRKPKTPFSRIQETKAGPLAEIPVVRRWGRIRTQVRIAMARLVLAAPKVTRLSARLATEKVVKGLARSPNPRATPDQAGLTTNQRNMRATAAGHSRCDKRGASPTRLPMREHLLAYSDCLMTPACADAQRAQFRRTEYLRVSHDIHSLRIPRCHSKR